MEARIDFPSLFSSFFIPQPRVCRGGWLPACARCGGRCCQSPKALYLPPAPQGSNTSWFSPSLLQLILLHAVEAAAFGSRGRFYRVPLRGRFYRIPLRGRFCRFWRSTTVSGQSRKCTQFRLVTPFLPYDRPIRCSMDGYWLTSRRPVRRPIQYQSHR